MSVSHQLPPDAMLAAHAISLGAIVGTFTGLLPPLAALMAMVWYAIQIVESETFQHWLHKKKVRRRHRRIKRHAHRDPPSVPGTPG